MFVRSRRISLSNMFRGFHRLIRIRREHGVSRIQNDMNFPASSRREDGYTSIIEDAPFEDAPFEDAPSEGAPSEKAPVEDIYAENAPSESVPSEGAPAEDAPFKDVYAGNARTEVDLLEHELSEASNGALDEVCESLDGVYLDRGEERKDEPRNPRVAK